MILYALRNKNTGEYLTYDVFDFDEDFGPSYFLLKSINRPKIIWTTINYDVIDKLYDKLSYNLKNFLLDVPFIDKKINIKKDYEVVEFKNKIINVQ